MRLQLPKVNIRFQARKQKTIIIIVKADQREVLISHAFFGTLISGLHCTVCSRDCISLKDNIHVVS